MTWIFNRPSDFAKEMMSGFVNAHAALVREVPGGVVRNTQSKPGSVAVVVGGGSGHYPAFAGLVGQGLAHGAAMGNLFASPSAQQICSVARAANNGAGVLLAFGNYAGDVLHFGLARERLRAEGIPCETLAITDDISSASAEEKEKRRGVAGDLSVFKIAAAAAERGDSLEDVLQIARRANDRTRTLGLAFKGCTLPGAEEPLFSVPEGMMGFGMGIHGEPGISDVPVPSAQQLASMLTAELLKERPDELATSQHQRVAVMINGLGAVKHEEMFVLWHAAEPMLREHGLQIADVQIGEFVTSFDMAGISVTLIWLDEELESLWLAPAHAPAFSRGSSICAQPLSSRQREATALPVLPPASAASQQAARTIMHIVDSLTTMLIENSTALGNIDAIAGDGDHGIGMERGARAARKASEEALSQGAGAGSLLQRAADAWADEAGGTSGAIWGVILNTLGTSLGNDTAPDARSIAKAIAQASAGVMHFGKAKPGDKTLVDVLDPFSAALMNAAEKSPLPEAWRSAAEVARLSAEATANMIPKIGRARPLAERSKGTPDAGAVSMAMIITTVGEMLSDPTSLTKECACPQL